MNNDLISRSALKKSFIQWSCFGCAFRTSENPKEICCEDCYAKGIEKEVIDNAPTVTNRPKGKWIEVKPSQSDLEDGIDYREECSICHEPHRHYGFDEYHDIRFATYYKTNFCPNCGADMRGEENEKT